MTNAKFRFLVVEICTGSPCSKPEVIKIQAFDSKGMTLIKCRNELIRRARKIHVLANYIPGDDGYEPASELISKFPFKDLVGYYHYDDGLTFLFRDDSPIFNPIVEGKISGTELAERLVDLHEFHYDNLVEKEFA